MTTPVPTRFTDHELALIDELVDSGIAENHSAVIRRGVQLPTRSIAALTITRRPTGHAPNRGRRAAESIGPEPGRLGR